MPDGIKDEDAAEGSYALQHFRNTLAAFDFKLSKTALRTSSRLSLKRKALAVDDNDVVPESESLPSTREKRRVKVKVDDSNTLLAQRPKRPKRGYSAPETYAHLRGLQDCLKEELDVMFCGINPGCKSATDGHHFAHATNHFWRCLHLSGFTPQLLLPSEDVTLPERFSLGLTNLVERPSAEQSELSPAEHRAGVAPLLAKIVRLRPRMVCFIGMGMAKNVISRLAMLTVPPAKSASAGALTPGVQSYKVVYGADTEHKWTVQETLFYVLPSTSARVTQFQREDKVNLFRGFKEYLESIKRSPSSVASDIRIIDSYKITNQYLHGS